MDRFDIIYSRLVPFLVKKRFQILLATFDDFRTL